MQLNLDQIKLVSWDVDGTLYSVGKMKLKLFELFLGELLKGRGRVASRDLALLRTHRRRIETARRSGGVLVSESNQGQDRSAIERHWFGDAIRRTGPRPGVVEVIQQVHAARIEQVIYSDFESAYKLEALGLRDLFTKIYVGESLGFVKPSPKVLEIIASELRVPFGNVLHIGDRVDTDEYAARAAGCKSLIFGRDFADFKELQVAMRPTVVGTKEET